MDPDRPFGLLTTWTMWLRLRHPALTRINLIASPALGVICAAVLSAMPGGLNFTHEFGVAHQVNGLLQILGPFFIGALAAISSLDRVELDMAMGGQQPTLVENGEQIFPTRREFFGYLFGYLAALSVLLYLLGALGMAAGSSSGYLVAFLADMRASWTIHVFRALYFIALVNLMLTTFLGLHFLIVYLPSRRFTAGARPKARPAAPSAEFIPDQPPSPKQVAG